MGPEWSERVRNGLRNHADETLMSRRVGQPYVLEAHVAVVEEVVLVGARERCADEAVALDQEQPNLQGRPC